MPKVQKDNSGLPPLLTDFFDPDDLGFDRLLNKKWFPAVNVSEEDSKYEIELAAPGMRKHDFKLHVENGILTISSECKEEKEEKKKNYTRQEYKYQSFSRSFNLPENAMEDSIKAHYEDGVLKLEISKKAIIKSKPKEIEIA